MPIIWGQREFVPKQLVDFLYLPNASHLLVKPWERMTWQQGNVDWFCFWLKGERSGPRDFSAQPGQALDELPIGKLGMTTEISGGNKGALKIPFLSFE